MRVQGLTRKKRERAGFESVGPVMAWGPMVRMGAGDGRLGGLRAPGAGWKWERPRGDNAATQKKGRRGNRSGWERPGEWGSSGSEGQTPGAGNGRCGERQVRGAEPGEEEPGGGGVDAGRAGGVRRSAPARAAGPAELELDTEPGPGRSQGQGRAGAGSSDMGSADSKLNFRKAVIQLTTKTQVRPGPPASPPTCRAGGWAGLGGCKNLACREIGGPDGQEGDAEARAGARPLGLYPRAPSPSPHPRPSLPGTSLFPQLLLPP